MNGYLLRYWMEGLQSGEKMKDRGVCPKKVYIVEVGL